MVFGDSRKIMQKMWFSYEKGTIRCKRVHDRICHLNKPKHIIFFYILRENNDLADKLANQEARANQGEVVYANQERKLNTFLDLIKLAYSNKLVLNSKSPLS